MKTKLEKLKQEINQTLETIKEESGLREMEIKYLGRKGQLSQILREIKDLQDDAKKDFGALANGLKKETEEQIQKIKQSFFGKKKEAFIDLTLPGKEKDMGHIHPISQLQSELEDLFSSLGFMIIDGPELESDYYNFTALNIPEFHPARDMQDTFYVEAANSEKLVMRTHTSPVQVRAMQKYGAPLRAIVPGRVFRCEATDACHEHTFHQIEGFMIGENISVANLIAVMSELLKAVFQKEVEVRVRPGFFPFVEPGIELDIKCTICNGQGCPACKHSGWLELMPAGMIHPNVLRAGGIDPEKYSGFAFGLGLTRLAMMKYGINDIRLLAGGDLRFLEQF
jgi:phenylalanyl-tRNA synthetase alpha chain